jgi:outer membrane protein assembly factor BamD
MMTFFPSNSAARLAGLTVAAALFFATTALVAQQPSPQTTTNEQQQTKQVGNGTVTDTQKTTVDAQGKEATSASSTFTFGKKKKPKVAKDDKVVQSKDTKADEKRLAAAKKIDPFAGKDSNLPDKQLYDKAVAQKNSGHFDVARLDLSTLLSTYPDSPYQMRAKLLVADSWYSEGGSAALAQAEQEYNDFITFFPNVPEAAEAQMRIGDIYFKQMDVPDRDYAKGVKAQDAYRLMLKQYSDAPKKLIDEARQKLREVQEVMATREAELGAFYATHTNWAATIARYQTVVDTYPQYSHMDDTLIGLGDAYEAEANAIRAQRTCEGTGPQPACIPEGPRAKLLEEYDGKAADAYRKVVLEHYAAPHVEDAKERLVGMNLVVPTPTREQVAASEALEGSRAQYTMRKRLELLVLHKPDTVNAAGMGEPPLEDPAPTTAPSIVKGLQADYVAAFAPPGALPAKTSTPASTSDVDAPTTPAAPASAAPLAFSDVAAPGEGTSDHSATEMTPATSSGGSGTGVGVEIVNHNAAADKDMPAATGTPDANYGLKTVAPKDNTPLPAIEKASAAPDQVNEQEGNKQPAAETRKPGSKKNPKAPAVDKADESSSKKKPKKGLDKLNPF